jgi:hypothetical protein
MSQINEIKDIAPVAVEAEEAVEVSAAELEDVNGGQIKISATIEYTSPK